MLPYDAKEYGRHNLGDVSRPETLAAGPQEIEVSPKGQTVMMAGAEPAMAAKTAKAGAAKGTKPAATTLMANRVEPEPKVDAKVETTAALPDKPARIAVADADGDPSAYQKLFGKMFSKDNPAPTAPPSKQSTTASTRNWRRMSRGRAPTAILRPISR